MFEVGFTEIILIFGIALLVLGPARLPKLAADLGRWAGRARAMARQLRSQLEQEVQFDPLSTPSTTTRSTPAHGTIHTPPPPHASVAAPVAASAGEEASNPGGDRVMPDVPPGPAVTAPMPDTQATPTTQAVPDERKPG